LRHTPDSHLLPLSALLLSLLLLQPAIPLVGATIPDAGSLLRDQQKSLQQPKKLPPRVKNKKEQPKAWSGVMVEVKGFTFSGYDGVATEAELQSLVAGERGKKFSLRQLNALVDTIAAHFMEKGWGQVRVWLPAQDITSGMVRITITQVKSDGFIAIIRDKSVRIKDGVLRGFVQRIVHRNQPVNEHDLERSLLLMNDLPGLSTKANFVPTTRPVVNSLEVSVTEAPLFSGMFWGDNQGNRYTGFGRGNAFFSLNDPLRYGDQMTLLLTEASGLAQGRVGYSFPVASNGIRANFAWSGMRYELGEELASLQYKGNSNSIDASVSYPVLRTRAATVTSAISYGFRSLVDSMAGEDIRDKQLNNVTLSMSGDRYDQLYGGGYCYYTAGITTGNLHESVTDITLTGTDGRYTRFNLRLARLQRLGDRLTVNLSGSSQQTLSNLDSSEKLSLGGPNGVRAYPVSEASGDEGQLVNADLRYMLPLPAQWGAFQLSGFYDAGHILLNKVRYAGDVSNITNSNDYWLQGVGVGVNYTGSGRVFLRATWAHVLGDNPGRSAEGNNSDGLNDKSRFWLQAMLSF